MSSTLSKMVSSPILGPMVKQVMMQAANNKAAKVSAEFCNVFQPFIAKSKAQKDRTYALRYQVYCEELGLELENPSHLEHDQFDAYSTHCYLEHRSTGLIAGSVRVIRPSSESQLIPIQKYISDQIEPNEVHPDDFKPVKICEISRLAVPLKFRRREIKRNTQKGKVNARQSRLLSEDRKCFPYLAIGLYFSAMSLILQEERHHCFVMIEPRLAKSLRFIGLPLERIGPVTDYKGQRAPYYVRANGVQIKLKHGFNKLYQHIDKSMAKHLLSIQHSKIKFSTR